MSNLLNNLVYQQKPISQWGYQPNMNSVISQPNNSKSPLNNTGNGADVANMLIQAAANPEQFKALVSALGEGLKGNTEALANFNKLVDGVKNATGQGTGIMDKIASFAPHLNMGVQLFGAIMAYNQFQEQKRMNAEYMKNMGLERSIAKENLARSREQYADFKRTKANLNRHMNFGRD